MNASALLEWLYQYKGSKINKKKLPCLEIEDIFIHLCTDFFFFYNVQEN